MASTPAVTDPFASPPATTPYGSRPASLHSTRSRRQVLGRSQFSSQIENIARLKQELERRAWLRRQGQPVQLKHRRAIGIVSRTADESNGNDFFLAEPDNMNPDLAEACDTLSSSYAFTMSSSTTEQLFSIRSSSDCSVEISPPYPVIEQLPSLLAPSSYIPSACAYICPNQRIVYVFGPSSMELILNAATAELAILRYMYDIGATGRSIQPDSLDLFKASMPQSLVNTPYNRSTAASNRTSQKQESEDGSTDYSSEKKKDQITTIIELEEAAIEAARQLNVNDAEAMKIPERKQPLWCAIRMCAVAFLVMASVTMGVGKVYREWAIGGAAAYPRMAILVTVPVFAFFSIFFFCVLVGGLFFIIGPVKDIVGGNNKYYSAVKPVLARHTKTVLPHVTVQMPVYKEGLQSVIRPTVDSVMIAIRNYEAHGGTANFYVAEDGMQAIAGDLALARQRYYDYMGIGWVARPKHEYSRRNPTGYHRRGKFKKASNLNYCLDFSLRVEESLEEILIQESRRRGCQLEDIPEEIQSSAYDQAMADELCKDEGKTLAAGDIRIGEVVLLIDCDTRVPIDCLLYGALEMEESPNVAIIQHSSGVMQVINNTFENAITYFTNLIYLCIKASVGLGDLAPFVGHNAFIRWAAVQDVAYIDKDDNNTRKFWTDQNVSEDFDIALRLETAGYAVRYATYHQGEFKEGVSLTVFDELLRWEKYAYGTSELIFNPLYQWIYKGPFSTLLLKYIFTTRVPGCSKLSVFAYLGTYFAMGFTLPLCFANYLLIGWFSGRMPASYLPSWTVILSIIVVFNVVNPLCYAWYRQRVRDTTFLKALWEHIKWTPVFLLFFNGLSFHILKALICHLFSLPIEWSSTEKEIGPQGLMVNLDKIMRQFRWAFLVCTGIIGGMIYLGVYAPRGWSIRDFTLIVPLALQVGGHILLPIVFAVIN